jgi:molybdenum cofactor cytidylyltransferase
MQPVGLLLAAGLGSRYDPSGRTLKLLQPVTHAGLRIAQAAALARGPGHPPFAVVRPLTIRTSGAPCASAARGCELVVCDQAAEGGPSIAQGPRDRRRGGLVVAR